MALPTPLAPLRPGLCSPTNSSKLVQPQRLCTCSSLGLEPWSPGRLGAHPLLPSGLAQTFLRGEHALYLPRRNSKQLLRLPLSGRQLSLLYFSSLRLPKPNGAFYSNVYVFTRLPSPHFLPNMREAREVRNSVPLFSLQPLAVARHTWALESTCLMKGLLADKQRSRGTSIAGCVFFQSV